MMMMIDDRRVATPHAPLAPLRERVLRARAPRQDDMASGGYQQRMSGAPSRDRRTTLVSASRFRCQRGDTSASSGLIARSNCATGSESASIHQRRAVGCTSGASCTQRWCLSVIQTRAEPARGRPESTLMWLLSQMGTGRCICESTSWVGSGVAGSAPANHAAPSSRQGSR